MDICSTWGAFVYYITVFKKTTISLVDFGARHKCRSSCRLWAYSASSVLGSTQRETSKHLSTATKRPKSQRLSFFFSFSLSPSAKSIFEAFVRRYRLFIETALSIARKVNATGAGAGRGRAGVELQNLKQEWERSFGGIKSCGPTLIGFSLLYGLHHLETFQEEPEEKYQIWFPLTCWLRHR